MGQEFLKGSAGQSLLGVSHKAAVRCWLGLESSEGSTGTDVLDDSPDKAGSQHCYWLGAQPELLNAVPTRGFSLVGD